MEELYNKIDDLKKELDKLEVFKELEILRNKIYQNRELVSKIKEYNEYPKESLRLEIYNYEEISLYKAKENEINLIILSINKKLKNSFKNSEECRSENN